MSSLPAEGIENTKEPEPKSFFEPDPVLGWRLKPGVNRHFMRGGERLVMEVDDQGRRPVPGQPAHGEKTLAAYGCSCVFGKFVTAEETFCAELQRRLPTWCVENNGVGNYGDIHSLLQLSRALRWAKPEYVMFGWIPGRLMRNVADVRWIQKNSGDSASHRSHHHWRTPRAYLDAEGKLQHRMVTFYRADFADIDFRDLGSDAYHMDQVSFAILERAAEIVRRAGGHFFLVTLLGAPSARLAGLITNAGIPIVDASVSGPDHLAPDGHHPGPRAHRYYAEKIHHYLTEHATLVTP